MSGILLGKKRIFFFLYNVALILLSVLSPRLEPLHSTAGEELLKIMVKLALSDIGYEVSEC